MVKKSYREKLNLTLDSRNIVNQCSKPCANSGVCI